MNDLEKNIAEIKAIVDFVNPKYRSRVEEVWSVVGQIYIRDFFGAVVLRQDYEPFTLNLPGPIKYTPDFFYVLEDGRSIFAEIKNSKRNKGYAVTLNKLKTASEIYPYFYYVMVTMEGGWKIKRIGGT